MTGADEGALAGHQPRASILKNDFAALPSLSGFGMGGSVSSL